MGGGWYTVFLENNACARQFEFTERKAAIRLGVTLPVADSFSWKHTQEEQKHPARHPLSPFTTGNATEQISTGKESKKYYSGLIIYSTYKYFSKKITTYKALRITMGYSKTQCVPLLLSEIIRHTRPTLAHLLPSANLCPFGPSTLTHDWPNTWEFLQYY